MASGTRMAGARAWRDLISFFASRGSVGVSGADGLICVAACELLCGEKVRHDGIGMAMTQLVFHLEVVDKFHVLEWPRLLDDFKPVVDRLSVRFFDGRKVGSRAFNF